MVLLRLQALWQITQETALRWFRNDGNLLAAAMAYYAALSFFPLLLVLIAGLGITLRLSVGAQNAQDELLSVLARNTAPVLASEVRNIMDEVTVRAGFGGPLGLATLLLGAIGIFTQLDAAFDRIWQVKGPDTFGVITAIRLALGQRLKAFLVLIGLGLVIIVATFASLLLSTLQNWASELDEIDFAWRYVQQGAAIGLNALSLAVLYKVLPKAAVWWRHALVGGMVVAMLWQLGSQALGYFIAKGSYSAYGVVGSFIAIMLWVYCASNLLFLGAQLVEVLGERSRPTIDAASSG